MVRLESRVIPDQRVIRAIKEMSEIEVKRVHKVREESRVKQASMEKTELLDPKEKKEIREIEDFRALMATLARTENRVPKVSKETKEILDFVERRANGESKDHKEYEVIVEK